MLLFQIFIQNLKTYHTNLYVNGDNFKSLHIHLTSSKFFVHFILSFFLTWRNSPQWAKSKCSRYRPGLAQRVGRGIALLFHDRGIRRGVSDQQHIPAVLYPRERPGAHFTGGWVGPRAGLVGREISPHRDSIPGPSSP